MEFWIPTPTVIPHLEWLMKTSASCTEAADQKIAVLSAQILEKIITKLPVLADKPIKFPMEFLAYLTRKGIKFSVE